MALPRFRRVNTGSRAVNQQLAFGRAFQIIGYQAGSGGHDPVTNQPVPVDVTVAALPGQVTATLPFAAGDVVQTQDNIVRYTLRLGQGVGAGVVSCFGLIGQIVAVVNPADAALVGTQFLYAVANIGYHLKLANETYEYTIELAN